jgi:hypothetical protein
MQDLAYDEVKAPTPEDLRALVTDLALARADHEAARQTVDAALTLWRAENAEILDLEAVCKDRVAAIEIELRRAACILYAENGDKHPCPGIGIRVSAQAAYIYDAQEAFLWAKAHDVCLELDRGAFEQLCSTTSKPVFVTVTETEKVTPTIAKDLGDALAAIKGDGDAEA